MITLRNLVDTALQAIAKAGYFEAGKLSKAMTEEELLFYIGRFITLLHKNFSDEVIGKEIERQYTSIYARNIPGLTEEKIAANIQQEIKTFNQRLIYISKGGILLFQKALAAKWIDPSTTNLPFALSILLMITYKNITDPDLAYNNKSFAYVFNVNTTVMMQLEIQLLMKIFFTFKKYNLYPKKNYVLKELDELSKNNQPTAPSINQENFRTFVGPYGDLSANTFDENANIAYPALSARRLLNIGKSKNIFKDAVKPAINAINTLLEFSSHRVLNSPINIENFLNSNPTLEVPEKDAAEIFFNALMSRWNILLTQYSNANFLTELPVFLSALDAVKQTISNNPENQSHFQKGFLNFYNKVVESISAHSCFKVGSGLPPEAYNDFFKNCDKEAVARKTLNTCLQKSSELTKRYAGDYVFSTALSNFSNSLHDLNAVRLALDDTNVITNLFIKLLPSFTLDANKFFSQFFRKITAKSKTIIQISLQSPNNFDTILTHLNEIQHIGGKLRLELLSYRCSVDQPALTFDTNRSANSITSLINALHPLVITAVQAHLNHFHGPQKTVEIENILARARATNSVFAQKLEAIIKPAPVQQLMLPSHPAFEILSDLPPLFNLTNIYGHEHNTPSPKRQKLEKPY